MTDSAHNLQKELVDVNNLWTWPTLQAVGSGGPGRVFTPEMSAWYASNTAGYQLTKDKFDQHCRFTSDSVSSRGSGWYFPGTFLDLNPGKYVISFVSDNYISFYTSTYIRQNNGNVIYGGQFTGVDMKPGTNTVSFEIPDGCCVMVLFGNGMLPDTWIKITDITIREGVL